jgi:tetratricopeptide (TPR) repeat protein
MGKYDEAEKMNRRALEGKERELGKEHRDTLMSVCALALVLQDLEKYDEAEEMNQRALEWTEKELGNDHPDTLTSIHNLASLLHKRKQYEEALELYRRACDGYKQKLGTQHPITIACLNHYSTMQQEAEQGAVVQRTERIHDNKTPRTETCVDDSTNLDDGRIALESTGQSNGEEKIKRRSLYACLKGRIRRKAL